MEVNFNRRTIISFPDNELLPDIETGIADSSLYVDEVLFTDRFTVGSCNSNQFECEIYDYPTVGKGEKIYVYQIIDETEGQEPVEEPIFTGYVDSCITNRGRFEDSKTLTAFDAFQYYGEKNVAKWWAAQFEDVTAVTIKHLRDSLFEYVGLECEDVTLPNDGVFVTHTQNMKKISFSAVLQYLMLINGANAKIDREGIVHFLYISGEDEVIPIDDVYAQNTSEFDTYTVPAYAGVRIINTAKNTTVAVGEDYNILDITDNLFLLKQKETVLTTIAENILAVVSGVEYKPAQIDMIYSQLGIKVGDFVSIGTNKYLVCENALSGSLLVDQHISSTGANAFEETSKDYDAGKEEMSQEISGSSLKYYRFTNKEPVKVAEGQTKPIMSMRYMCDAVSVVTFQGCAIIDVEVIDSTKPATVKIQYYYDGDYYQTYEPTETYFDFDGEEQRHTLNLLHFWEYADLGVVDFFKVYATCENCKIEVKAFKEEAILSGMGLIGEASWDGFLDVTDNAGYVPLINEPQFVAEVGEDITITLHECIYITIEDEIAEAHISMEPVVEKYNGYIYLNKTRLKDLTWQGVKEVGTWQNVFNDYGW